MIPSIGPTGSFEKCAMVRALWVDEVACGHCVYGFLCCGALYVKGCVHVNKDGKRGNIVLWIFEKNLMKVKHSSTEKKGKSCLGWFC